MKTQSEKTTFTIQMARGIGENLATMTQWSSTLTDGGGIVDLCNFIERWHGCVARVVSFVLLWKCSIFIFNYAFVPNPQNVNLIDVVRRSRMRAARVCAKLDHVGP